MGIAGGRSRQLSARPTSGWWWVFMDRRRGEWVLGLPERCRRCRDASGLFSLGLNTEDVVSALVRAAGSQQALGAGALMPGLGPAPLSSCHSLGGNPQEHGGARNQM